MTKKCLKKFIDRKVLPRSLAQMWPRGRVIYRKMLREKACCQNFVKEKENNPCFNKNKSVEKIIGRLFVKKKVCDQKLLQKTIRDRKAFDPEKFHYQN